MPTFRPAFGQPFGRPLGQPLGQPQAIAAPPITKILHSEQNNPYLCKTVDFLEHL